MVTTLPSRDAMLDLLRNVTTDFRLRHYAAGELGESKPPTSGARFVLNGKRYELFAEGDTAQDTIVEKAYRLARDVLGRPMRDVNDRRKLEQQILAASYRGDDLGLASLTRELVSRNDQAGNGSERSYTPLKDHARKNQAPFGRRQAW